MIPRPERLMFSVLSLALVLGPVAFAQSADVEIQTVDVADGVYMLIGQGGNIGVSAGDDGVFLVDDQFAPLTEKIKAAVAAVSDQPIRFQVNTHWHYDHTGGNENLGKEGVIIVAHDNVRKRLSAGGLIEFFQREIEPSPKAALPVITFADSVSFHLNGDELHVFHVPAAHTDGDSIIHFKKADVVHMGDLFFNGLYPFIDTSSGGSIDGLIAAIEKALAIVGEDTKVIPGHGPLASRADLATYLEMLKDVRTKVGALVEAGKSLEETVAAKPTAVWDDSEGQVFLSNEQFISIVYDSLTAD